MCSSVSRSGLLHAHRRDVDAGDLELRRGPRAVVRGARVGAGDVVGEHHGLLPQRRDQAVDLAAVLDALADRVDVRVVHGAHLVVDDDRPLDGEPAGDGEVDVRPDAGGDDDHVAFQLRVVQQPDAADLVLAHDRGGPGLGVHLDAERSRRSCAGSRRRPGRSGRSSGAGRRAPRRPAARRPAARGRPPGRAGRRRSRPPGGGRRAGRSRSSRGCRRWCGTRRRRAAARRRRCAGPRWPA